MGKTRITTRTLPSGEKVRHYPPDEKHPEGRMTLIPRDTLAEKLLESREAKDIELGDIHTAHFVAVADKQADDAAHPAVPPEKRFI